MIRALLVALLLLQLPQTPVKEQPSQAPRRDLDDEHEDQRKPHPPHPHAPTTTTTTVPPTTTTVPPTTTTVPPTTTTTTVIPTTTTTSVLPPCVTQPVTLYWDTDPASTAVSVTLFWWGDGGDAGYRDSATVSSAVSSAIVTVPCRPEPRTWTFVAYATDLGGVNSGYSNEARILLPAR